MAGNVRSIWNQKILGFEIAVKPAPLRREFQHAVVRVRDAPGIVHGVSHPPEALLARRVLQHLHGAERLTPRKKRRSTK